MPDITSVGQAVQWKAHHRKLCKRFNLYSASPDFLSLETNERVDAILLSQLVASIFPDNQYGSPQEIGGQLTSAFFDLMKRSGHVPPICSSSGISPPSQIVEDLFSRFANNNFVLHSHLTQFAHGIFPVASRLLNHSCIPNCVAKYVITPGQAVKMEVVALRDIQEGEEAR